MKRTRKPIGEMLAASNQGESKGIVCPKCGCLQFRDGKNVRNTVPEDGGVRRYRVCRVCGKVWTTHER